MSPGRHGNRSVRADPDAYSRLKDYNWLSAHAEPEIAPVQPPV